MKSTVAVLAVAFALFHAPPALAGPEDLLQLPSTTMCGDPEEDKCLCIGEGTPLYKLGLCGFGGIFSS